MTAERGDAELAVPETVQALMAARLDTLRPELKALVHDASVVGRVFWSSPSQPLASAASAIRRTLAGFENEPMFERTSPYRINSR